MKESIKYLKILKESARKKTNPNLFCIGLDLEYISRENFISLGYTNDDLTWVVNKEINNIPCILQFSTDNCCVVINLKELGLPLPNNIIDIITSMSWIKFGVGISNDLKYLNESYNLKQCNGAIELYNYAVLSNFENPNLENLYKYFFNDIQILNDLRTNKIGSYDYPVGKRDSTLNPHNWLEPLTKEQFQYVVVDAYMSYKIGMRAIDPLIRGLQSNIIEIIEPDIYMPKPSSKGSGLLKKHAVKESKKKKVTNDEKSQIERIMKNDKNEDTVSRLQQYTQIKKYKLPTYTISIINNVFPNKVKVTCICPEITDKVCEAIADNKQKGRQEAAKEMLTYIR